MVALQRRKCRNLSRNSKTSRKLWKPFKLISRHLKNSNRLLKRQIRKRMRKRRKSTKMRTKLSLLLPSSTCSSATPQRKRKMTILTNKTKRWSTKAQSWGPRRMLQKTRTNWCHSATQVSIKSRTKTMLRSRRLRSKAPLRTLKW